MCTKSTKLIKKGTGVMTTAKSGYNMKIII